MCWKRNLNLYSVKPILHFPNFVHLRGLFYIKAFLVRPNHCVLWKCQQKDYIPKQNQWIKCISLFPRLSPFPSYKPQSDPPLSNTSTKPQQHLITPYAARKKPSIISEQSSIHQNLLHTTQTLPRPPPNPNNYPAKGQTRWRAP